jgi:hypothetical protein
MKDHEYEKIIQSLEEDICKNGFRGWKVVLQMIFEKLKEGWKVENLEFYRELFEKLFMKDDH